MLRSDTLVGFAYSAVLIGRDGREAMIEESGITKAGFMITSFYEDRRSEEDGNPIRHFMPSVYVVRAQKIAVQR